jgi:hypothetical protein
VKVTLSDLQHLMHQIGPAMPEISTIVQESMDCWMVEFDENVSLQLAWTDNSKRTLMTCALGQPAEDEREAIYASLLMANLQLTGVANIKLALSDINNDVMLIGEYDLDYSSIDELRRKLSEFLGFAGKFSLWVAGTFTQDSPTGFQSAASMHVDSA